MSEDKEKTGAKAQQAGQPKKAAPASREKAEAVKDIGGRKKKKGGDAAPKPKRRSVTSQRQTKPDDAPSGTAKPAKGGMRRSVIVALGIAAAASLLTAAAALIAGISTTASFVITCVAFAASVAALVMSIRAVVTPEERRARTVSVAVSVAMLAVTASSIVLSIILTAQAWRTADDVTAATTIDPDFVVVSDDGAATGATSAIQDRFDSSVSVDLAGMSSTSDMQVGEHVQLAEPVNGSDDYAYVDYVLKSVADDGSFTLSRASDGMERDCSADMVGALSKGHADGEVAYSASAHADMLAQEDAVASDSGDGANGGEPNGGQE